MDWISIITALATAVAAIVSVLALRSQIKQNRRTIFENTFFNMMQLQQQIVDGLSTKHQEKIWLLEDDADLGRKGKETLVEDIINGRDVFYHTFVKTKHTLPFEGAVKEVDGMRQALYYGGFKVYHEYTSPTYFDHYFRHLYTILKYIDQNEKLLSKAGQYQYASILRATLSRHELVWLYYNGLSDYGKDKLKPLLEKYCMLKNMREDLLSLCKENKEYLDGIGITLRVMHDAGFEYSDYVFYLTDKKNDKSKYHLSAFYNKTTMQEGVETLNKWRVFEAEKRRTANA
ncbi:MAG: putative phage abortive infection protein [Bacteroidales bacterium]|nr:putative phage abortive infection protein [Bacteroidales bacterium]